MNRDNEESVTREDVEMVNERCRRLEVELERLEHAIMAVIDSGEKLQAFRLCLQSVDDTDIGTNDNQYQDLMNSTRNSVL